MCGIAGIWDANQQLSSGRADLAIRNMIGALNHRGPDDEGVFSEQAAGVHLGFRRLSIVDLSPLGHQPMVSASGRYIIVFNGEVYNHRRLRLELEQAGIRFRGHSDTEVMLAAIEHWGLAPAVARFNGMFAFALWDAKERCLTLVRDRVGIKPLYYGWVKGLFVFGSELKCFHAVPGFDNEIDRGSIAAFLRHNYVPAPGSIYRSVFKLMPGTMVRIDRRMAGVPQTAAECSSATSAYWSALDVAQQGYRQRAEYSDEAAVDALETLLRDAVSLQMEADVPLGAFLSGGIDSSTVVALMQAQSRTPIRTFSIGFHEQAFNEAPFAGEVARHLGTYHSELYVTPADTLAVIPKLPEIYDEPFSDASQIPTFLVSKMAREFVTVSLSGDGGDELFAGYNRYMWGKRLWGRIGRLPGGVRGPIANALRASSNWTGPILETVMPAFPRTLQVNNPREKIGRLADLLHLESFDALYRELVSHWKDPETLVVGAVEAQTALTDPTRWPTFTHGVERMMYFDLVGYLPDDILTKLDRASMSVSLEARVPLLDHRVVEFAWSLPFRFKVRRGDPKWLLKQVLYRHVPKALLDRPKQGFGVPLGAWLRGPLRDWAEALLDERRLRDEGFLEPRLVRQAWSDHLSGRIDEQYRLWDVLMFQAWLERYRGSNGALLKPSGEPHTNPSVQPAGQA